MLFADDAVIRRVDAEGAILLGGGRALLMQIAHPQVAAGVAEHSDFEADPLRRLVGTLDATYSIVFGSEQEAERTAAAVRSVHDRVTGIGYAASDPALLCWVNATLVDTALRVYTALLGPLHAAEREAYYQQSTVVAEMLGCPRSEQPENLSEFKAYVRSMVGSLEVTDTARRLARSIFHPDLPWVAGPPVAVARFLTVGMLPSPLRQQFGLRWDPRRELVLRLGTAATGTVLSLVPRPVRHAPKSLFLRRAA